MKLIKLNGKHAVGDNEYSLVPDDKYYELIEYDWYARAAKYPNGKFKLDKNGKVIAYASAWYNHKCINMHRFILAVTDPKIKIDHINHNTLDNTYENLRICSSSQNGKNSTSRINSTSSYLGVCWDKRYKKWLVQIKTDKQKYIGHYHNEIEAAEAYDLFACKYHQEFANLNFPENLEKYITNSQNATFGVRNKKTSKYIGVYWLKQKNKWTAKITINNRTIHLGFFDDEEQAAYAYDIAIFHNNLKNFNFPEKVNQYKTCKMPNPKQKNSRYKGVSWISKSNKWVARITLQDKTKHLGTFETEAEAFVAYCNAKENK